MRRQGLIVNIGELQDLIFALSRELTDLQLISNIGYGDFDFQIDIINRSPNCSDTWEIEKGGVKKLLKDKQKEKVFKGE